MPTPMKWLSYDTQAARIFKKFGGPQVLAKLLNMERTGVYKWAYPNDYKHQGTGGLIPNKHLPRVRELARLHGILLTAEDLMPDTLPDNAGTEKQPSIFD